MITIVSIGIWKLKKIIRRDGILMNKTFLVRFLQEINKVPLYLVWEDENFQKFSFPESTF